MFAHESPAVWLGHGYLQLVAATSTRLADAVAEGTAGGEILAQVVEPDETRQAITFLIVCLVGIAILLAVLTVWYWQFTSPKRRARALLSDLGHFESDRIATPSTEVPVPTEVLVPAEAASSLIIESKSAVCPPAAPSVAPPVMPKPAEDKPRRIEVADRAGSPPKSAPIFSKIERNRAAATITQRGPMQVPPTAARPPRAASNDRKAIEPAKSPSPQSTPEPSGQEGLSDDDWAAVMQSAFDKLKQ